MTHVLLVTAHYAPENTAPAVRMSETALQLVRRGYQVTVLTTFPDYAGRIVPGEYRNRLRYCELLDGVHVVRVRSYAPHKDSVLAQISFGCLAPWLGSREISRPDVMVVASPPLLNLLTATIVARRMHFPFILRIGGLCPEKRSDLPGHFLFRWWVQRLERSMCRNAAALGAATESLRAALIRQGLDEERVFLLTDGIDTAKFYPLSRTVAREKLGWDGCFTLLYVENSGLTRELATFLDAAEALLKQTDIRFVLAGEGATREHWRAEVQRRNLTNVTFFLKQPHDHMRLLLSATDACLIALDEAESAPPTILLEAMACVRAVLLAGDGEVRTLVEREAALYVDPGNATALVEAVLYLRKYPEVAHLLGIQGRALVEERFEQAMVTAALEEQITRLLQ